MLAYEFALAVLLITSPAQDVRVDLLPPWSGPWRAVLVNTALQMELLDRREAAGIFAQRHSFLQDLELVQARFHELKHAPLLEECRRFANRDLINDFLAFNRAYRSDLVAQMAIDQIRAEELRGALNETDQLYAVWNNLRDAQSEFYYVTVRRRALLAVRMLAGDTAFYTGALPPHVPTWRFPVER
ncbi:MAG: hypothetical protein HY040_01040 [Planctomycetes bacterium]|nr:hypothetical protein [Planctomycetota bacterium]